jgi:hypothetical protein
LPTEPEKFFMGLSTDTQFNAIRVRVVRRQYRYIVAIRMLDPISWLTDDYSTATVPCVGAYDRRSMK